MAVEKRVPSCWDPIVCSKAFKSVGWRHLRSTEEIESGHMENLTFLPQKGKRREMQCWRLSLEGQDCSSIPATPGQMEVVALRYRCHHAGAVVALGSSCVCTRASPAGVLLASPPAFWKRKKNLSHMCLSLFSEISESFCLKFPLFPQKSESNLATRKKKKQQTNTTGTQRPNHICSRKQGHFQGALALCNTASPAYVRHQIPIPSSTVPLGPIVSQPCWAAGPGLCPATSCCIGASQDCCSCQPRHFPNHELLTVLHCNTLCISNRLFLEFWVLSHIVTQGMAEDFVPRPTELGVAFTAPRKKCCGTRKAWGRLGPQEGAGVMEQWGMRAGRAGRRSRESSWRRGSFLKGEGWDRTRLMEAGNPGPCCTADEEQS